MNCFIFSGESTAYQKICGRTYLDDLAEHLKNSGIDAIYTDSDTVTSLATRKSYREAIPLLGENWLGAYEGIISRQSPGDLLLKAYEYQTDSNAISLGCSGEPWKHLTVLAGKRGVIQSFEHNPSPENTLTNLCFSGLVLVRGNSFDPEQPLCIGNTSAFLIPGYWSIPRERESYLRTAHEILSGMVTPWSGKKGVVKGSQVPESCRITGTLWLGQGCRIGENCIFENCVIMDSADIGSDSSLKNCLVNTGASVKPGTLIEDKYLTLLGE